MEKFETIVGESSSAEIVRVSVVIPTFNRSKLIGRAIESVLRQSAHPDQVIVIDDGSSDDTEAVCRVYQDQIEYHRQSNAGPSAARNTGIRLASHPWIAFLDSDDIWTLEHLSEMKKAIAATHGEAAFYFANLELPAGRGGGTLWEVAGFSPIAPFELVRDASTWLLMKEQPSLLQASVFRRTALKESGLAERFRYAHDLHLFFRLGIGGTACAVNHVGCRLTRDDQSLVRLNNEIETAQRRYADEQCQLWQEVKVMGARLPHPLQNLIRFYLAASHGVVSRQCWRSRQPIAALRHLLKMAAVDPTLVRYIGRQGAVDNYAQKLRRFVQVSSGSSPTESWC